MDFFEELTAATEAARGALLTIPFIFRGLRRVAMAPGDDGRQ